MIDTKNEIHNNKIEILSDRFNYDTFLIEEPWRLLIYQKKSEAENLLREFDDHYSFIRISHASEPNQFKLTQIQTNDVAIRIKIIRLLNNIGIE
jgi:hypothetical protein